MKKFENVFAKYKQNYEDIFNVIYPAKNSTGFTERNLSVNFAKAYESVYHKSVTWFEFQFGEKNNLHYDAVIINPEEREILIIESKRFNKPSKRIEGVKADVLRINRIITNYSSEFTERISDYFSYNTYGIILADVWTETKSKIKIYDSFCKNRFLIENNINLGSDVEYNIIDFDKVKQFEIIKNNYHLVSFAWQIKR